MKFVRGLGIVLLSILILVVVLIGGRYGYDRYHRHKLTQELESLMLVDPALSQDAYLQAHMDEDINDEGLTVKEKLARGLDPFSADTDEDGLPDFDEIGKYETDPLKFSTAGDGIADGIKVLEGLDPLHKIEAIPEIVIEDRALNVKLVKPNLNDKYLAQIKPYTVQDLIRQAQPLTQPFTLDNYQGDVAYTVPEGTAEEAKLFYYNFDTRSFDKIKGQKRKGNIIQFANTNRFPIFLCNSLPDTGVHDYYYFRVSVPLIGKLIGMDHKILIFQYGGNPSQEFTDKPYTSNKYGVSQVTLSSIGWMGSHMLDLTFRKVDHLREQVPEDGIMDVLMDYGRTSSTYDELIDSRFLWLRPGFGDEEKKTAEQTPAAPERDKVNPNIIDSGFDLSKNAFKFANLSTTVSEGGVCAGFSRITERLYNGEPLETKITDYNPRGTVMDILKFLGNQQPSYDLSANLDDYPFLQNDDLYAYRFTDSSLIDRTGDAYPYSHQTLDANLLQSPDKELIQAISTQWFVNNDIMREEGKRHTRNPEILDELAATIANKKIVSVRMLGGKDGHAVNVIKVEKDPADPDTLYLHIYDNNLPEPVMKHFGIPSLKMKVVKQTKINFNIFKSATETYFEFDYHPSSNYGYTDMNKKGKKATVDFFVNDQFLTGTSAE